MIGVVGDDYAVDVPRGRSAPDAHGVLTGAILGAAVAVGRAHVDDFPGLHEWTQEKFVPNIGRPAKRAHGWFQAESWRNGSEYVAEIYINVDTRGGLPADELAAAILSTVIHELSHAWNYINNVPDTSRGGRYHPRAFAEVAIRLGNVVVRDPSIGHRTAGVRDEIRWRYADELRDLADALTLVWAPNPDYRSARPAKPRRGGKSIGGEPGPDGISANRPKYVGATCGCVDSRGNRRALRVAAGWWFGQAPIICGGCGSAFQLGGVDGDSSTLNGDEPKGGDG